MNELSIIIPCIDTLPKFVDDLALYIMNNPSDVEIIIVVNESVKSTGHLVNHVRKVYPWLKFEILQRKGAVRNYGALIRFGMAYSISRYVVAVSAYGDDDISLILTMLNKVRKGAQLVQVTRYANVADASRVSWRFRFYQSLYRRMTKLALGMDISDSTYGFKMFDRVFVQALGLTQNGYSISPEITFKTLLAGGKVEYVSSSIKSTPFNKDFKLRREGLGYLWLLIQGVAHKIGILWF